VIEERVLALRVVPVIEEWRSAGGVLDALPPSIARTCRRLISGEQESIGLDALDRLLLALDRPDAFDALAPVAPRIGRAGYFWPSPHPLRRLTPEQVAAAHVLHLGGMSIRELGRQLYERNGYASAKSCSMALCDAFKRAGLHRRDRIEATVIASTTHGRGSRSDKAAYKRWHRETYGAWPSDSKKALA
jgi:hypothetical protein